MNLKYKNITISGGVATGKNTLFESLKPFLEPIGFKFRTTGQIIRDMTGENVMPLANLVSDDFNRQLEKKSRYLLEHEDKWVIEAWLSGFIARDLKDVLKVLLVCSEDAIRIDRVVNRDKVSVDDAKRLFKKREEENFKLWRKIYGKHDFFDKKYYNLVIDTFSSGPLETVGKVLDKIGYNRT